MSTPIKYIPKKGDRFRWRRHEDTKWRFEETAYKDLEDDGDIYEKLPDSENTNLTKLDTPVNTNPTRPTPPEGYRLLELHELGADKEYPGSKYLWKGEKEWTDNQGLTPYDDIEYAVPIETEDKWAKEKKAFAEGKRIQAKDYSGTWYDGTWDFMGFNVEYRIHPDDEEKPWSLPEPPPDPYAEAKAAYADGELQTSVDGGVSCRWLDWRGLHEPRYDAVPKNYRRRPKENNQVNLTPIPPTNEWTENTLGVCPCDGDMMIEVMFNNGLTSNKYAARIWGWCTGSHPDLIKSYRLPQNQTQNSPKIEQEPKYTIEKTNNMNTNTPIVGVVYATVYGKRKVISANDEAVIVKFGPIWNRQIENMRIVNWKDSRPVPLKKVNVKATLAPQDAFMAALLRPSLAKRARRFAYIFTLGTLFGPPLVKVTTPWVLTGVAKACEFFAQR